MRKLNVKNTGAQGIVGSENPTPTGQTKSMTRPASSSVISYFPAKVKEIACAYHGHGRGADGGRCIMPEIGKNIAGRNCMDTHDVPGRLGGEEM